MDVRSPHKNFIDAEWRILLIDGDEDDFILIRDMLKEAKGRRIELYWAATYEVGQTKLTEDRYDAVLLDNDLGARTGIELIRALNERGFTTPLILFNGRGSYEVDLEAMKAGATIYLSKNELSPLSLERFIRYAIERKQAEEALRESEAQYRQLFESMLEAVFVVTPVLGPDGEPIDYRFFNVNASGERFFGKKREAIIGHSSAEVLGRADPVATQMVARVAQTGKMEHTERYSARLDRWHASNVYPNGVGQAIILTSDITERKRAEKILLESEERERNRAHELAAILDAVPAYIFITHDPDSQTMTANRATQELLRSRPGDNISKSAPEPEIPRQFRAMRYGKEIPNEELPVQLAAAKCIHVEDYEFDVVFEDGSSRRLMGNAAPLCDEHGAPAGAVGAFMDITDLRRIEQETSERTALMEVQRRLLEHREMERMQIARDLHDGPIQSLGGLSFSLQMLQSAVENGQASHAQEVQEMIEQVKQDVRDLVGELRGVCNELRPPMLERFGFRRAVEAHVEGFQDRHPEIKLVLDMTENQNKLPENIATALFRIYQEALNNIVRHSEATEISIHFAFDPQQILLEIRDNGKGFTEKSDWVELVRQGHFGLVGMKERAEAIGGEFKACSSSGEGTTIRVSVPMTN